MPWPDRSLSSSIREQAPLVGLWEGCPACGYRNEGAELRCGKCGRRLGASSLHPPEPPRSTHAQHKTASGRGSTAPVRLHRKDRGLPVQLRRELSARVQQFRSRHLPKTLSLPFEGEDAPERHVIPFEVVAEPVLRKKETGTVRPKRPRTDEGKQPGLEFSPAVPARHSLEVPPVASLSRQLISHAADLALTLAAWLAFLIPIQLVAAPDMGSPFFWAGAVLGYALLCLLYGVLFLCGTGKTPAMMWTGLQVVTFDGGPAGQQQFLWRVLGGLISAGSFLLGFLWAAVDEEGLSWHDRISKTFLARSPQTPAD